MKRVRINLMEYRLKNSNRDLLLRISVVVQFDFNLASTGSASVFLIKRLMTELVEVSFNKTKGQTVPLPEFHLVQ